MALELYGIYSEILGINNPFISFAREKILPLHALIYRAWNLNSAVPRLDGEFTKSERLHQVAIVGHKRRNTEER
jgi:hypothetical protein